MESKVVSVGRVAAPTVHGKESVRSQPAWMSSSIVAIAITTFIAVSAIVGGRWLAELVGLGYAGTFIIAGVVIVGEMYALQVIVARLRMAYQRDHAVPPTKPLDLAA